MATIQWLKALWTERAEIIKSNREIVINAEMISSKKGVRISVKHSFFRMEISHNLRVILILNISSKLCISKVPLCLLTAFRILLMPKP